MIVDKKRRTCRIVNIAVPVEPRVKVKESKKRDKYQDIARELEKYMKQKSDGDTNCNWRVRYSHQRISTMTGGLGNKRTSGDHPNYSIVKIGQDTEKSSELLRRHAITQTPMENHQLTPD